MVISVGVDSTVIANLHKLCDEMEDSLKAMKAALLDRGLHVLPLSNPHKQASAKNI